MSCFSSEFYPRIVASIAGLACDSYYYGTLVSIFYFPHFFYIYYLEFFCRKVCLFCPIYFIYIIINSLSVWTHGYLFYSLCIIQYCHNFFTPVIPVLAIGALSGGLLCSLFFS